MNRRLCCLFVAWGMLNLVGLMLPLTLLSGQFVLAAPICDRVPSNAPNHVSQNLDNAASRWGIYCAGKPRASLKNVATPSLDGKALRCGLLGAKKAYSNVQCYRLLQPQPAARAFTLTLSFWYSPTTTLNNQGGDSIIQALEFSMSKTKNNVRREFALQWANVLGEPGDPQWRYWDGRTRQWLSTGITQVLTAQTWHAFQLVGDIQSGRVHYAGFSVDGDCYVIDQTVSPAKRRPEPDQLVAAVQLDGNASGSPYELVVDRVSFVRSANPLSGPPCP